MKRNKRKATFGYRYYSKAFFRDEIDFLVSYYRENGLHQVDVKRTVWSWDES